MVKVLLLKLTISHYASIQLKHHHGCNECHCGCHISQSDALTRLSPDETAPIQIKMCRFMKSAVIRDPKYDSTLPWQADQRPWCLCCCLIFGASFRAINMVQFFSPDCNHTSDSHTCTYFRFPSKTNKRKEYDRWETLITFVYFFAH